MTTIDRARACALALAATATATATTGLAGCGGGPSCEKAMARAGELRKLDDGEVALSIQRCKQEGWSSAMRGCIADADDEEELARCAAKSRRRTSSGAFESYMERSKASEAELELKHLEKALKTEYVETATFPVGEEPPTPAAACCEGPGHKCAPDPSLWRGHPVWEGLDFEITEPTYFQYSYVGTASGQQATVSAVGDLDCDGVTITYVLQCDGVNGNPECVLTRPPRVD